MEGKLLPWNSKKIEPNKAWFGGSGRCELNEGSKSGQVVSHTNLEK